MKVRNLVSRFMRDYLILYINGQKKLIYGEQIYNSLSSYLRDQLYLKGTKIVCEEGDCGACTVLKAFPNLSTIDSSNQNPTYHYEAINSCITYLYLLDCCHIITVEAVKNCVQDEFVKNDSSQCGFCTPGFVMSLTALAQKTSQEKKILDKQTIKEGLIGNLCRCTGYAQIIDAGLSLFDADSDANTAGAGDQNFIDKKYYDPEIIKDLLSHQQQAVSIKTKRNGADSQFFSPTKISKAQEFLDHQTKIFSSATDLGVQINKMNKVFDKVLSTNLIKEFYDLKITKDHQLKIGSKVSLSQIQSFLQKNNLFPEFDQLLNYFASPQIRNSATLIGNIVNASPIGDTLPFLMICNAQLVISGKSQRVIDINNFYKGYKSFDLDSSELISSILIPLQSEKNIIKLYKVSKRKDLDISCVSAAFLLKKDKKNIITDIKICYGGVGPTVLRLKKLESKLKGEVFTKENIFKFSEEIKGDIHPMSDVRGSDRLRFLLSKNLFKKFALDVSKERLQ